MFSGLMSRCAIPRACSAATADVTRAKIARAARSGSRPPGAPMMRSKSSRLRRVDQDDVQQLEYYL